MTVSKSSVDFNVFSGMASKRFIDTESFLFKHVCDQHFVQNMRVSRSYSNHAISTSLTRKVYDRAHISCTRSQFASRSWSIRIIYLFITFLPESFIQHFFPNHIDVLSRITAAFLSPNVLLGIRVPRGHQCARIAYVFSEICRSRYRLQYTFFRTAVRNYSTSHQVRIIWTRILSNNYRITNIAYCPLWTNLNSTQQ